FKPSMIIQNETLQLNQIEAMRNFFTLYTVQSQQLDEDAINVDEELEQCKIIINQLTEQLDEIELCRNQVISKELHVLLESHSSVNPNLEITYTVDHVSWTPSYDIRLSSSTATLKIIYYGIIRQNTGEDWDLGKLTLSTAEQDHFNNMPELILEKLSFKNNENVVRRRQQIDKSQRKLKARSFHTDDLTNYHQLLSNSSLLPLKQMTNSQYRYNERKNEIYSRMDHIGNDSRSRSDRSHLNVGNHQRSSSTQRYYTDRNENHQTNDLDCTLNRCPSSSLDSIILKQDNGNRQSCTNKPYLTTCSLKVGRSTNISNSPEISNENYFPSLTFEIPKPPKCIRGNGEPHRVTIGTLEFKPQLQYITIPKQTPKAFLRVTMHNISEFALLEGQASVYIDSNFIGKTKLFATAVQEEFTCELGYDPGIRVTYMPRHKYQKSGRFLGNKTVSIIFKQIISVENSYPRSIKLLVIDQLPVSTEEKLKVQLIEPSIKNPDKYNPTKPVRISKTKLVEWDVELAPYESRELVLKYLVEHPAIKDIDISTLGIR
ncbi:Protein F37C4.5, partial [Schistosoma japonicum]